MTLLLIQRDSARAPVLLLNGHGVCVCVRQEGCLGTQGRTEWVGKLWVFYVSGRVQAWQASQQRERVLFSGETQRET
jgi:hypothetical protein